MSKLTLINFAVLLSFASMLASITASAQPALESAIKQLNRSTEWEKVAEIPVPFDVFHPQGFALVDGQLFLSSVEIIERTRRYPKPETELDRTAGKGKGHLFKMSMEGELLDHVELGEDSRYHPGGIDFDGTYVWVPVAEYRPNSESILYYVDPASMEVHVADYVSDHIGGVAYNVDTKTLTAVSWGSRRIYTLGLNQNLEIITTGEPPAIRYSDNPSHYIDYQDCANISNHLAVCTGLTSYYQPETGKRFSLGGVELLDLNENRPIHQAPILLWTENGLPITQNPVAFEIANNHLRMYAMPEDNNSRLFIFETKLSR